MDKEYMKALDDAFKANSKYVDIDDYTCRIFRAGYEACLKLNYPYLEKAKNELTAKDIYKALEDELTWTTNKKPEKLF